MLIIAPAPSRDITKEGKKAQEYEKDVPGGIKDGQYINTPAYENALEKSGVSHEEAVKYWKPRWDAYSTESINDYVSSQAPTVSVQDNKIRISAPQIVLDSPITKQLQQQLGSLQGMDLSDPNVKTILDELNNEIKTSYSKALVEESLGWSQEDYDNYQRNIQVLSSSNPLNSKEDVAGREKDGKIVMKKPGEWLNYYQTNYNADERNNAFLESQSSNDPYTRTMALVMAGPGGDRPVYGFNMFERTGQGVGSAWNQISKTWEDWINNTITSTDSQWAQDLALQNGESLDIFTEMDFDSIDKLKEGIERIKKTPNKDLSDSDKALYYALVTSRMDWGKDLSEEELKDLKAHTDNIKRSVDFQKDLDKNDEQLARNLNWSASEQTIGNIAGTVGRFWLENAIFKKATGISMNQISDQLGAKMIDKLAKWGVPMASNGGTAFLKFVTNLIGTIPEDILQTTVDNVITGNAEENNNLLNPKEMSDNFRNNFIIMAMWNAIRAGYNPVKQSRLAKQIAKQAELNKPLNIEGLTVDMDDINRGIKNGGELKVEGDKVSVEMPDGTEKTYKNVDPETGKLVQRSLFDLEEDATQPTSRVSVDQEVGNAVDDATRKINEQQTVKVEVDTPDGMAKADVTDYRPRGMDDALKMEVDATPAGTQYAQKVQLDAIMKNDFQKHMTEFHDKFGDVRVSDFDWVLWNIRQGLTPEQVIGAVDPTTGREVTQNMIDAMKWWSEQPAVKNLREASRKALGLEGDFDMLGYLPHTDYNPTNMAFDEALTGMLWQQSTGASMMDDVGNYKGYGGDFESRYRTFASNMLWDAKSEKVAAAKLMEEAQMDGVDLAPEKAVEVAEGAKKINEGVAESTSVKDFENQMASDSDEIDFKKIEENTKKDAQELGLGKATHENYSPVYYGANTGTVTNQRGKIKQGFDTLGNTMRKTEIAYTRGGKTVKMNMYDSGAADIVYAKRSAIDIVNRFMRGGSTSYSDLRDMLIEYIQGHSGRSLEHAEYLADKWMAKLGEVKGELTKAKAIQSLSNSMKWEAYSRLRRFLVIAKYDEFNKPTKDMIDRFLFNHMQTDVVTNSSKIASKMSKMLDGLTGLRYRALFYGNIKNALLQTTELNRFASIFKWGDVATMARRMATDEAFRARVDDMYYAVAPMTDRFKAELYQAYADVAESAKVGKDGVTFRDMGKKAKDAADKIGLAPIEAAEAFKNRMMVAALVQEADSLGLTGDDALRHIRRRFERVALAVDELGQLGFASNPLGRTALFLQNFQIRELGMHWYNIQDLTGMADSTPRQVLEASKYLTKVVGAKMATALIMARLGYPAAQTLGLDPFGLLGNYNEIDEEDMEWQDYLMKSPLFSGGMTSIISDIYFMSRRAFEESNPKTISEEVEEALTGENSWGLGSLSFDDLMGLGQGFIPGSIAGKRIGQMNEMMDTGWATSATGNKMYTAPTDPLNITLGYLFGRGATENAQQYNQTYGDNLLQTLGRFNPLRQYGDFDPIDSKNYTDWFKGDSNDLQQFNKGIRYFKQQRDNILNEYNSKIQQSYDQDQIDEAQNNMNQMLDELFNKLDRFVDAYEAKNGTIDSSMVKQIINTLNTNKNTTGTREEREARSLQGYNDALGRYSQLGFSPVGTYTGPTESNPDKEVKYQGSPQWRAAISGYYDTPTEAVNVLKQADAQLKPLRDEIKGALSAAYDSGDYDTIEMLQYNYLDKFDQVVSPIIASYGVGIFNNTDVTNQIKNMLSTGTNSRSGNLIPTEQYKKDKYGRFRSMPLETVDMKKWLQQRFRSDAYKNPTIRSNSTTAEDLSEIKRLYREGKTGRARTRALELKVRVDNQVRSLNKDDYNWLTNFLNQTGGN